MDPYQLWRRGLISYETYLDNKNKKNINVDENTSTSVMMIGEMNVRNNETWEIKEEETAFGYIGPKYDLENEGNIQIAGDVLFYCNGKGIDNTGTMEITGSLEIKTY